jgi:hypothetical protein
LFRRRAVWLPTVWGVALLLAIATALAVTLLPRLGDYLAPTERAVGADGHGARLLVVEGWLDDDALDDAVVIARSGGYERVVTSGGPIEAWRELQTWPTFAERAADYLRRRGVRAPSVDAAPAPATLQERSYLSAVAVRDWAHKEGLSPTAIDVFSAGVHARRSRLVYRLAFGAGVAVGIVAAPPHGYALERWWSTSDGAKTVLGELLALAWTKCCFWPSQPDRSEASGSARKSPA